MTYFIVQSAGTFADGPAFVASAEEIRNVDAIEITSGPFATRAQAEALLSLAQAPEATKVRTLELA